VPSAEVNTLINRGQHLFGLLFIADRYMAAHMQTSRFVGALHEAPFYVLIYIFFGRFVNRPYNVNSTSSVDSCVHNSYFQ